MMYYLTSFKVLLHFVPEIHTFGIKIIKGNQTKHNLIKHVSWIKGFVKKIMLVDIPLILKTCGSFLNGLFCSGINNMIPLIWKHVSSPNI